MTIQDCIFIENHGRYFSNCLHFSGLNIIVSNSTFINNTAIFDISIVILFLSKVTGLPDIAEIGPEIGGSLSFQGVNMVVNGSCFIGGTGFKGGAIYINSYDTVVLQNVLICNCYFKGNSGNAGGAINFSINLKWIDAVVAFCVYIANVGKSIVNYYYRF